MRTELSHLGEDLYFGDDENSVIRQARTFDILRYLSTLAKGKVSLLLLAAAANGYNKSILKLLQSSSQELIDCSTMRKVISGSN